MLFDNDTLNSDGNWLHLFTAKLISPNATTGILSSSQTIFFDLYPNPTSGIFQINSSCIEKESLHVNVYDALGQNIYTNKLQGQGEIKEEIDLSKKSKGIYLIEIISERSRSIKKVIVE